MKKMGLVVTGASHFVGIADFVKICRYFHVEPPGILTKFGTITSEIDPEAVLRSFSGNQTFGSLTGDDNVSRVTGSTLNQSGGMASLLGGGGGGGAVEGERPSSRGSCVSGDISSSPANASEEVDIRRLALAGGGRVTVVVRSGESYLLKVELPSILPSHSRDVLETIRRTYGITVLHASKAEISLLKNKGVVGGKAGRCALFSARDVCQMFHHWKTSPPPPLAELAEGKLPSERLDSMTFPPSYPLSSYGFPLEDLPSFPDVSTTLPHSSSTSFTPSHPPTNLSPFSALPPAAPTSHHQTHSSHVVPRLSHPPSITSSPFPLSSQLSADHFQQPIQLLQSVSPSQFPPPSQPPFSTSHYPLPIPSHALFSTPSHPPYPTPQPHHQRSNFGGGRDVLGIPPPITTNYPMMGLNQVGKPPVVTSVDYPRTPVKMEGGGGRKRSLSTTGPPLDDQELDYVAMVWGEHRLTLVCPPGGAEPFLAIPELVDKVCL
ncbi:hypothetical protein GBAR_LOCUS20519 [Geodia barretti]|uniref:Uncharacterized protein n=1 Tax=Geodia barretti TaxID=519541 RepID=A0AA35X3G2_GEOBA|nr:hypothetical protein GBAR_LOCUS20519 [Geodia barretti]